MKIVQSSDYMIFFDDVRVDQYVINWNTWLGLFASDASATVTMYRTDAMDKWKAYLTQVRIFAKNIFTGKFTMVFEGEITGRQWGNKRSNIGQVSFSISGFFHWLQIPIPLRISTEETLNRLQRFIYEAQNINVEEMQSVVSAQSEILMKDKTVEEVIFYLLDQMNKGYYDIASENSAFGWAKIKDRFKVMVDVLQGFRESGFMDLFTFVKGTQIETFYVYLNEILSQMMFEFYQDRDGTFKIKNPSWAEPILKAHILDEIVVDDVTGMDNWAEEPTRVLAIGGSSELIKAAAEGNSALAAIGYGSVSNVPVGLYIGTLEDGEYYSTTMEVYNRQFGVDEGDLDDLLDGPVNTGEWFDNLTGQYVITSGHRSVNAARPNHKGTDYGTKNDPIYNIGGTGKVIAAKSNAQYPDAGGNRVYVTQTIDGTLYEFRYMHLDSMAVKTGDTLKPGAKIGISGNTGVSRGAHLHLEIWEGGRNSGKDLSSPAFLKKMKEKVQKSTDSSNSTSKNTKSTYDFGNVDTSKAGEWKTYEATAYTIGFESTQKRPGDKGYGITRSGLDITDLTVDHRVIATSESQIPMHSIVEIKGMGLYRAEDTGGDIKNGRIDILYNSLNAAKAFGRRDIKARVVRVGGSSSSSSSKTTKTKASNPFSKTDGNNSPVESIFKKVGAGASTLNPDGTKKSKASDYKPVQYNGFSALKFTIPSSANDVRAFIVGKPNGVDANMAASIIANTSGWNEKYSTSTHTGLMALPKKYSEAVLGQKNITNGMNSVNYGSKFFAECLTRFSGKATFALAAYWIGDMAEIEKISTSAGGLDFIKARPLLKTKYASALTFVDMVIDDYVQALGGDYLQGDPHKQIFSFPEFGTDPDPVISLPSEDTELPDYESPYKPIMSDEELRYKINLKIVEQQLIRSDSPANEGKGVLGAQELIYRYARYMMQVYRAQAHTVNVSLKACLPSLRPGFNAWLEPTRADVVFYITGVGHQGSFAQGCYSTVKGSFVRTPDDFDDIDETIFMGETRSEVSDFGTTLTKKQMKTMRKDLATIHNQSNEIAENAENVKLLKDMYTVNTTKNVEFTTGWNEEYSAEDIEERIVKLYKDAPQIIKDRKKEIKEIMDASEETFIRLLFKTAF